MPIRLPVLVAVLLFVARPAAAQGPSYDCTKATASMEKLVCGDQQLSALDRQLAEVYAAATKKAANEHPPTLKATQRGWVKGRDDCWKGQDQRACVKGQYEDRIVELQATYRLLPPTATVRYACDGNPANEVVATYFPTSPPSATVEHGDETSLMLAQPMASGTKYVGRNETLSEHQGVVEVVWGYGAPVMKCRKAP
jgi:uncharacterized protein